MKTTKFYPFFIKKEDGLSLVELMVAMTIGLFILILIAQVYLAAKNSFSYQAVTTKIQENGRYAMDVLSSDMRNLGFQGCGVLSKTNNVVTDSKLSWWLDTSTYIRGYEGVAAPVFLNTNPAYNQTPFTDAIVLLRGDSMSERMIASHDFAIKHEFTTTRAHAFQIGEILVATDCKNTAIFRSSGPAVCAAPCLKVEHDYGTTDPKNCYFELGAGCDNPRKNYQFRPGGFLSRLVAAAYYIAPATTATATNKTKSLWVQQLSGSNTGAPSAFEVVEGVENMQLVYGVADAANDDGSGGTATRYMSSTEVDSLGVWNKVVSVRVELLLRSPELQVVSVPQSYTFNGVATVATDKAFRRVYYSTIALRNRTP